MRMASRTDVGRWISCAGEGQGGGCTTSKGAPTAASTVATAALASFLRFHLCVGPSEAKGRLGRAVRASPASGTSRCAATTVGDARGFTTCFLHARPPLYGTEAVPGGMRCSSSMQSHLPSERLTVRSTLFDGSASAQQHAQGTGASRECSLALEARGSSLHMLL